MKTYNKLLKVISSCSIVLIACAMLYGFLSIKDVSVEISPGDYIIVNKVNEVNHDFIAQMNNDVNQIKEKLSNHSISAKTYILFDPDLPAYHYVDGSNQINPYKIQVCEENFLRQMNIEPQKNTLYRLIGESDGDHDISINMTDKKSDFKKTDFEVYTLNAQSILMDDNLPEVLPHQAYVEFNDFITIETFEELVNEVYEYSISDYQFSKYAQYNILISTNSKEDISAVNDVLKEDYNLIASVDSNLSLFNTWRNWSMVGALLILFCIMIIVWINRKEKKLKLNM